jgi:FAD:protein FMN transferase
MTEKQPEACFVRSSDPLIPGMRRFSHEAMATTFEILAVHEDERYARQAAAAAFDEVERLEDELSRFRENTDITRINNLPAHQPLRIGPDAFACLELSVRLYHQTQGAFDVTIGSLLKCWRNEDGSPRTPTAEELNRARLRTGTNLLQLNEREHTVCLSVSGLQVDLGGIGKGYAVDALGKLLREWGMETTLISGGYSSILALDAPAGMDGWPLTLSDPADHRDILARPALRGGALSGSGVQKGGHIISPRTGRPIEGRRAAWASARDAGAADALSTAFMIMDLDEIQRYCSLHPETVAMVILQEQGQEKILRFGCWREDWLRE